MSSRSSSQILLKNGLVLIHDSQNHVVPTRAHVLIEGGTITKVGPDVEPTEGTEIVDCTDKIVSPGFVDTHHHGWQTQLKGRHANEQLLQYMVTGEFEDGAFLRPC